MIANNVVALGSTVVFARLLDDYGSLAALISFYLILSVVGQALQVATARDARARPARRGPGAGGDAARLDALAAAADGRPRRSCRCCCARRSPAAVGVDQEWAAAIGLPAGVLWLLLSLLRGGLQGTGDYRAVGISLVGEQGARLVLGAALAAVGPRRHRRLPRHAAVAARDGACTAGSSCGGARRRRAAPRRPRAPARRLRDHVAGATAPIAGLVVVALLQNVDIIAAKHRFSTDMASSYGATAVAAKVLVWVAIGRRLLPRAGDLAPPRRGRGHATACC